MRGQRKNEQGERELRAWIARMAAVLAGAGEVGDAGEAPSEAWRAFNLSNVARGRVEQALGRRKAPGAFLPGGGVT